VLFRSLLLLHAWTPLLALTALHQLHLPWAALAPGLPLSTWHVHCGFLAVYAGWAGTVRAASACLTRWPRFFTAAGMVQVLQGSVGAGLFAAATLLVVHVGAVHATMAAVAAAYGEQIDCRRFQQAGCAD
jgi:hypothetical protein